MSRRRSGEPKSDGVRTAAASNAADLTRGVRSGLRVLPSRRAERQDWWVSELAGYDRYGPIIGAYCDWVADDVASLEPFVEVSHVGRKWTRLSRIQDDEAWVGRVTAAASEVVSRWDGGVLDGIEIRARHARALVSGGIAWIYDDPTDGIQVLTRYEVEVTEDRSEWRWMRDGASKPYMVIRATGGVFPGVWYSWTPDPQQPNRPYTELVRVIPHIREYISAKRRQQADASSAILQGLAWFDDDMTQMVDPMSGQALDADSQNGIPEVIFDYAQLAKDEAERPYWQKRGPSELMPNPMFGGAKPELVDLTRPIDNSAFELEKAAIEAIARGLRAPTKLLTEGPGNAKYDNESLLYQAWLRGPVEKYAQPVFRDWSRMWFAPAMAAMLEEMGTAGLPDGLRVRLWFDTDELMPRQDDFKNYVDAVRWGGLPAEVLAEKLRERPMDIPEDMTDYDLWFTSITGGTGDPGQAIDRRQSDSTGKDDLNTESATADRAANSAVGAVGGETFAAADESVAPDEDVVALVAEVENLERRTWMVVEVTLAAVVAGAFRQTEREFRRRIPSTDRGKVLRRLPLAEILAATTTEERSWWNLDELDAIVTDAVEREVVLLETKLTEEAAFVERALGMDDGASGLDVSAAKAVALSALIALIAGRVRAGKDDQAVPNYLVAEIGLAFSGAKVVDGMVVRNKVDGGAYDPAGRPVSGMMMSPAVMTLLESVPGLMFRWVHSFYRVPVRPYPDHVELDGRVTGSRWGIDGHRPQQDENGEWCTCALLPFVSVGP